MNLKIAESGTDKLKKLAKSTNWQKMVFGATYQLSSKILKDIKPSSDTLHGKQASEFLEKVIPAIESATIAEHSVYGAFRWFWYLRRIPHEMLEGEISTTFPYDRSLAETVIWKMPTGQLPVSDQIHYPVDHYSFRHLCAFLGKVKLLSHMHVAYRCVGKGATLKIESGVPFIEMDKTLKDATQSYDKRHALVEYGLGAGLGLSRLETDYDYTKIMASVEEHGINLLLTPSCQPISLPVNYPVESRDIKTVEVEAQYFMSFVSFNKVIDPYEAILEEQPGYLQEIVPVIQFQILLYFFIAELPWVMASILRLGYFFARIDIARDIFNKFLPECNSILRTKMKDDLLSYTFDMWLEASSKITSCTWPPASGSFVHLSNQTHILFDTSSATNILFKKMIIDKANSKIGNIRGTHFEYQCQELINETKWKPTKEIAPIRGKTLRFGGKNITDIDAIGVMGKSLILVSCKSVVYDHNYDKGEYSRVRNVQTGIDEAVDKWSKNIEFFKKNSVGENYDFSEFEKIIGVVCTPVTIFSNQDKTLSFVEPGLHACVSSNELFTWLCN